MIAPQTLAFDIDGVVADTMQLFLDILKQIYAVNHITYDDITQYQLEACLDVDPAIIQAAAERIIDGDYSCRLLPMDGAQEILQRLHAFGPIRLVTARPHLGPIREWMDALLPPDQYRVEMTTTGKAAAKPAVLKVEGIDFFVEDRLDTCFLLHEHGIKPIVFVQPWNREPHPFIEVHGWRQLESLIQWAL